MSQYKHLDLDKTLEALGPIGIYQLMQIILTLLGAFPASFQLLGNVYIGPHVDSRCAQPSNATDQEPYLFFESLEKANDWNATYDECEIVLTSNSTSRETDFSCKFGFAYDHPKEISVRSEFDLVCPREALFSLSQSLVFAGQGTGALVGPILSDRRGRKISLIATNIGMLVTGAAIAFSPNFLVFAISKFLAGFFQQGYYLTMAIVLIELLPTSYRRFSLLWNACIWAAGCMTMTVIAYLMEGLSWRYLQMVYTASSLLVIIQIWAQDETMVWLHANGATKQLDAVMKRAARINRKDLKKALEAGFGGQEDGGCIASDALTTDQLLSEKEQKVPGSTEVNSNSESTPDSPSKMQFLDNDTEAVALSAPKKLTLLDILRVRRLLISAAVMWLAWFSCAMSYFTLYLTASTLSGNKYINFFLMSLMETPACIIFFIGFNRLGRKATTMLLFAILGSGVFAIGLFKHFATDSDSSSVWNILTLLASLYSLTGASGVFFSLYFWMPELFPTNVRNQAIGVASMMARVGAMISPFTEILAKKAIWAPGLIMGVLSTISTLSLMLLPETKNKELPQTIEDVLNWYRPKPVKGNNTAEKENLRL